MGCVLGKSYGFSPNRLEGMKVENGYVKGSGVEKQRRREQQQMGGNNMEEEEKRNGTRDQKEKIKGRDGIGNGVKLMGKNDQSQRGTSGDGGKIGGDELVDIGWPKWLVDNIPKEVLVGLVPKTADSYDKVAKVS